MSRVSQTLVFCLVIEVLLHRTCLGGSATDDLLAEAPRDPETTPAEVETLHFKLSIRIGLFLAC